MSRRHHHPYHRPCHPHHLLYRRRQQTQGRMSNRTTTPSRQAVSVSYPPVHECAAAIVRNQQLSLTPSLACFTVIGNSEPRLVELFPNSSCTCPTRDNCYHVFVARLAVGMTVDSGVKKRAINLTQLRKNTCKRTDKTSGRKRPRLDDVDVVPAGDADDDEAAAIHTAIVPPVDNVQTLATVSVSSSSIAPVAAFSSSNSDSRVCNACDACNPQAGKCRRRRIINWVCCDQCDTWYHMCCVHLQAVPDSYVCGKCN